MDLGLNVPLLKQLFIFASKHDQNRSLQTKVTTKAVKRKSSLEELKVQSARGPKFKTPVCNTNLSVD